MICKTCGIRMCLQVHVLFPMNSNYTDNLYKYYIDIGYVAVSDVKFSTIPPGDVSQTEVLNK